MRTDDLQQERSQFRGVPGSSNQQGGTERGSPRRAALGRLSVALSACGLRRYPAEATAPWRGAFEVVVDSIGPLLEDVVLTPSMFPHSYCRLSFGERPIAETRGSSRRYGSVRTRIFSYLQPTVSLLGKSLPRVLLDSVDDSSEYFPMAEWFVFVDPLAPASECLSLKLVECPSELRVGIHP